MAEVDNKYGQLAKAIIDHGYEYTTANRPDVKCKQLTSVQIELPLTEFPLITTKEMFTKGIVGELLWFLRGDTNIKYLVDNGINIWNKDAYTWYLKNLSQYEKEVKGPMSFENFISTIKNNSYPSLLLDYTIGPDNNEYTVGNVGANYGYQWRKWTTMTPMDFDWDDDASKVNITDQIKVLIDNLKSDYPINRRHIVTAWNPAELNQTALPPCHWSFEILPRPLTISDKIHYSGGDIEYLDALWNSAYIKNDKEAEEILARELAFMPNWGFTLKWHQRSVDTFLGLPFNIASYALLSMIIGRMVRMKPLSIIGDLSNVHFYEPHIPIVLEQLKNNPNTYSGCGFEITFEGEKKFEKYDEEENIDNLFQSLEIQDFTFPGYQSFGKLKAEMFEQKK